MPAPCSTSPKGHEVCQALSQDEQTPCTAIAHGHSSRYCREHGREYGALTRKYKTASRTVRILQKHAQLTEPQSSVLVDAAAVDEAILSVQSYIDALGEEIEGRRMHHKRFFPISDEGHMRWLGVLMKRRASAELSIARLRRQRESIVAEEARQKEEHRRHLEAQAESQRMAAVAAANQERERIKAVADAKRREEYRRLDANAQRMAEAAHQERERIKAEADARRRRLEAPTEYERRAVAADQERRAREAAERRTARPPVQNPPSRPAASWRTDLEAQTGAGERVPLVAGHVEHSTLCLQILVIMFFIIIWAVRS